MTPVMVPASAPAANATTVASTGCTWATSRTAATDPPSVTDPSAVMSGNAKILKLMNTPSASSDRIKPIVTAPMSSSMVSDRGPGHERGGDRRGPARTPDELALAGTRRPAIVVQQVQHAEQLFVF